ncbi:glycosylhydrolase-like jelly roll fold domain-containing protein [Actinophytocola sp. KF-1]
MVDYRSRHPELHADFVTPDPAFSPAPIWWWSGGRVTLPGLRDQLDKLVDQGVHNVVVINLAPSGPSYGALADEPALLSDDWWALWAGLCAHARDRGARLWFYDQIGFSGANLQGRIVAGRPAFAGASLEYLTGRGELRVPDGGDAIAAWAVDERRPLAVHDGRATHDGEILLAYQLRRGFDYTSPQACAVLFDQVHGEFERRLPEYLGDVVVGSFQDELPSLPTWSPRFAEEFAKRCGYRIETLIGALWHDWGPESARVRVDYQRVRAALAEEAFFAPLHEWHERHGMTVGVDQQSPSRAGEPLGTVRQYADYPRTHRWYSAPGSDHWGDAKLHSSLAHHYGRPRTWIEAFHSTGWGGTLEETVDWLLPWLLSGATLYNPHAVYYATGSSAGADWWEWAPPSTCWRQPYWPHYRHFADTVSRLCKLLTRGEHVCDVGVLFPATTVAAGTLVDGTRADAALAHRTYLDVVGRMLWFDTAPGALRSAGLDFDVLDDHTVATASVRDGALHTRGERYRVVVVPACTVLAAATARRLVELASDGGQVVLLGALPEHADTPDGDEAVARLRELGVAELPSVDRPVRADTPVLRRRVGDREVLLVTAGEATVNPILPGTAWSDEAEDLDMPRYNRLLRERGYTFDPSRRAATTAVWLAGTVTDVEQWDPLTGTASPAPCQPVDGGTEVTVAFDSAPAAVLVWSGEAGPPVTAAPSPALTPSPLPGPWRSTVDAEVVEQWRPWHRIDGEWRQVLVTYGEFAQVSVDGGPWRPVAYSLSRGIEKDPVHVHALGPKGRVPEEFWHVEEASTVRLRTFLPAPPGARTLAVAANGPVEVWWNGTRLPDDPGGYLRLFDVECADRNRLAVVVRSEEDGPLRGYWALTDDPAAFARPEWLTPADGSVPGTTVRASASVVGEPGPVMVQLGTEGAATFLVNGVEAAVQGAFDPYATRPNPRVLPHEIVLAPGENRLEVVFRDMGTPVSLIFDGPAATWSFTRDGAPVATALRRRQSYDPRWPLLRARPHPLPRATWLDGAPVTGVLDVVPDSGHERRDEWFRLVVPPGARRVRLPIVGEVEASVDGVPVTGAELPPGRELLIRVTPEDGRTGGALWDGPAEFFRDEDGTVELGPWEDLGLGSFSGAVGYHRDLDLSNPGTVVLDLGAVRGTAEVHVNGRPAGVRIWSPYRFDLTGLVRDGTNSITVTVRNTLGPRLDDTSPTLGVYAGQRVSGLLGPVTLWT